MGYDIETIRAQVRARLKKGRDPSEFRAPKVDDGKTVKFRFYILPPLMNGDVCNDGKATCERNMELFAIPHGSHYIDNKKIGCPRVVNEEECAICQYGFDLLSEIDGSTNEGKKKRGEIGKMLLPAQYHAVNLYFPPIDINPEELRGKVFWFNAPKTVVDIWLECLYRDDDGGDPEEPLPFGVFFDENNAYQFQLEVTKDGQMNSYKKSKFIGKPRPIAVDKTGKRIDSRITEILAKRFNLWEKIPAVDKDEVAKVAAALSGRAAAKAGASSGGFDHDEEAAGATETVAEAAPAKPAASKQAAAVKAAAKPAATKPAAAAAKPAAATKPAAAKPAAKPAAKAAPKKEEAVEEAAEEAVESGAEELAGEVPFNESEATEAVEAEASSEVAEEAAEESGSDEVDGEVDRLLDELNS